MRSWIPLWDPWPFVVSRFEMDDMTTNHRLVEAQKTRFIHTMLRSAHAAIESKSDPMPYVDNVNALVLGKGLVFFVDGRSLCVNSYVSHETNVWPGTVETASRMGLAPSIMFEIDRAVIYHPDGRREIMKDRKGALEREREQRERDERDCRGC